MAEQKTGFVAQIKSFPKAFWVANTMEIFERMSWYGWFTVMAVYVTGSVATGGLGFSTELRGTLQAIIPFFLYLLPVLTGALADRYGFKRMFIIAYAIMIVSYYLLGQFTSLPGFVFAFTLVAIGAAIFKPVVVGTVARVTNDANSSTGFGIFYMMVNVGGFLGPIIAGRIRGWGWEWVFVACSGWAVLNMLLVLIFYKEPARESADVRKLSKVLDGLVEVLGNLRFFITVGIVLVGLVLASVFNSLEVSWFSWGWAGVVLALWIAANLLIDLALPKEGEQAEAGPKRNPLARRMRCSNWRFALFLLIMSGFWTSFNQIFYTMPEYIRDFTETRPMIHAAERIFGKSDPDDPTRGVASNMATINDAERQEIVRVVQELKDALAPGETPRSELFLTLPRARFDALAEGADAAVRNAFPPALDREELAERLRVADPSQILGLVESARKSLGTGWRADLERESLEQTSRTLLYSKVRLAPDRLRKIVETEPNVDRATNRIIVAGRQMNPEYIVNINALGIVLFQVLVSFLMGRFHRFTTMIVGMLIAAVGIGFSALAGTEGMIGAGGLVWIVAAGILTFSFGEMMASPTSQEYVGRIAPANKKALYMGYYFVATALGNLFGGILSGQFYGTLARDMQRPDLMWLCFGGVMLFTALIFVAYNRFALPRSRPDSLTG
ncbi:MAG: MFS transporter [Candidatus Eisenbacteria bacterium]|nr:MFS transporter [Candidatus Eisenbacteria bacterium]